MSGINFKQFEQDIQLANKSHIQEVKVDEANSKNGRVVMRVTLRTVDGGSRDINVTIDSLDDTSQWIKEMVPVMINSFVKSTIIEKVNVTDEKVTIKTKDESKERTFKLAELGKDLKAVDSEIGKTIQKGDQQKNLELTRQYQILSTVNDLFEGSSLHEQPTTQDEINTAPHETTMRKKSMEDELLEISNLLDSGVALNARDGAHLNKSKQLEGKNTIKSKARGYINKKLCEALDSGDPKLLPLIQKIMQDERVQLSNKTMKKYGLVVGFDLEPYSKEFKAALATNNQHPKKVIFERACNAGYKKALENGQYEVMDFFQRLYDHGNYNVKGFKQEFIRKLPLT